MSRFDAALLKPSDVLVTRSDSFFGKTIRLGAALTGKPNTVNHVIIAHHFDDGGTFWGIEGRPGGVGWVELTTRITAPFTNANVMQPRTVDQRLEVCRLAEALLGTPYDWSAIASEGMEAIRASKLWKSKDYAESKAPAHVVCSSYADWVYAKCGLPAPSTWQGHTISRTVAPADWDQYIIEQGWQ